MASKKEIHSKGQYDKDRDFGYRLQNHIVNFQGRLPPSVGPSP